MDWIFRWIVALAMMLVGGGVALAAVRTWFSGEPYLPGLNAVAIVIGFMIFVFGVLVLFW